MSADPIQPKRWYWYMLATIVLQHVFGTNPKAMDSKTIITGSFLRSMHLVSFKATCTWNGTWGKVREWWRALTATTKRVLETCHLKRRASETALEVKCENDEERWRRRRKENRRPPTPGVPNSEWQSVYTRTSIAEWRYGKTSVIASQGLRSRWR